MFEAHALGGAPGAVPFALLFVGTRATPLSTSFGPARIDVAPAVPVAVLPLPPGQPSAIWGLTVPNNPALAGFELAVQALIAHDLAPVAWRLSGLVAETVVH